MTTHTMKLNTPWYEFVQNGEKIYEGRRATEKVLGIKTGDKIMFIHATDDSRDNITVDVLDILSYPTFRDALESLPMQKVLPITGLTIDQGVDIYKKYVSLPTQIKDGVIMIKIKRGDPYPSSIHLKTDQSPDLLEKVENHRRP
jgi:ASC-1-like (ASCH) protein